MDIAIISEHASPANSLGGKDAGGQNIYVAQLAKHLVTLGHRVEVFSRKESFDDPLIIETQEGYKIVNVIAGPQEYIDKEKILPFMDEFSAFIKKYIKKYNKNFDVVHANFWMSGIVALELKRSLKIPFAITFHALGRVRRLHQGKGDLFPDERFYYEDEIVSEADAIIAECPQDFDDLKILYKANTFKTYIVPCGFDSKEMKPLNKVKAKESLGLDPNVSVILHLGRMVPRKGADNVIRGFSSFKRMTTKKIILLIVGGESTEPCPVLTPEIGRLKKIAEEEGVSHDIYFTGKKDRDQLRKYYSAADVFVTTPWYEPFGITPIEAMACGTPVIGSRVGGIKYSVLHNKTGLLVPPNDPHALSEALFKIINDTNFQKELSAKAITRAHNLFKWEKMASQIDSILKKISGPYAGPKVFTKFNQEVFYER